MADGELWEFEVARSNRVYSTIQSNSIKVIMTDFDSVDDCSIQSCSAKLKTHTVKIICIKTY